MVWTQCAPDGIATLSCIPLLIQVVIYWALIFAGIVAIFLVIYGGYKYINSGGDPKQADTARKTLMYAVFGLLIVFMSFFVIRVIGQTTGLDKNCYTNFGFSNCDTGSTLNSGNSGQTCSAEFPHGTCAPGTGTCQYIGDKDYGCVVQPPCLISGKKCSVNAQCCSKACIPFLNRCQ